MLGNHPISISNGKYKFVWAHPSLIEKKFIKTYHPNGKCGIKLWLYVSQNQLRTNS